MSDHTATNVPHGLAEAGRRLWESVAGAFDLEEHERRQLVEACRTADGLDELDVVIRSEGVIVTDAKGRPRTHPAVIEARAQRALLTRLIASLRLPSDDVDGRPQRRGAARGVYRGPGAAARNARR